MTRLLFDIETDGLLDTMSKIHCIVTKDLDNGTICTYYNGHTSIDGNHNGYISDGIDKLKTSDQVIGHNIIGFDLPAIRKLSPTFKPRGEVTDTLVLSRLIFSDIKNMDFASWNKNKDSIPTKLIGSHGLKAWGYRLNEHKGEFGETSDWKEFTPEMLEYCVQDVEVLHKLYDMMMTREYSPEAIKLEHQVAHIIQQQIENGWEFDVKAAEALYMTLLSKRYEIKTKLQQEFKGWKHVQKTPSEYYIDWKDKRISGATKANCVTAAYNHITSLGDKVTKKWVNDNVKAGALKEKVEYFNPNSAAHKAIVLKDKYGWESPELTDTGKPKINEDILEKLEFPEAKMFLEYDVVQDRIEKLKEGRNGGWLDKVRKTKTDTGFRIHGDVITNGAVTGRATHRNPNLAQVPAVAKPYGKECRSLFVARPNHLVTSSDLAGLELRCLAHYMYPYDGGAYAKAVVEGTKEAGTDVHTLNMKAAGLSSRDQAKTFIYGFLYGAGPAKIGLIVGKGAKEGQQLIDKFLAATPALKKLREAVSKAISKRPYLIGLDGRRLHVRSEHAALNTLLQSAGAIIAKRWLVEINELLEHTEYFKEGVKQIAWIHDEVEFEVPAEHARGVERICVEAARRAGEYFKFKCPIGAEARSGLNWSEVH